jgi:hypothetical protein
VSPSKPEPPTSYEERTGALLAQVADLLLHGKQDWRALERLEAALEPPKPGKYFQPKVSDRTSYGDGSKPLTEYGTYTMGGGVAPTSDVMSSLSYAYERKLAEMLAEDKTTRFRSLYSGEIKGPENPDHSHTLNPSLYDYTYKKVLPTDPAPITAEQLKEYLKMLDPKKIDPDIDK